MSYGDEYDDTRARSVPAQTRTRLPEQPDQGPRRPTASPGRTIGAIVGVVVLLLAAIVLADRAGGEGEQEGGGSGQAEGDSAEATAPTGEQPVDGSTNGIPRGFAQTGQGAQSAAANYAVALGGTEMFDPERRHTIVDTIAAPTARDDLQAAYDAAYSPGLNERLGLDEDGLAPQGDTFVNRTMPVGSSLTEYADTSAEVSVWCAGLTGIAGLDSQNPVRTSWFTLHLSLSWAEGDWKVVSTEQSEGPTPVNGDNVISGADEIAEAVQEYGGFTYAR
ncbi:hypothetical protein [Streptomyces hoynatensis]|uniref:DUF8175 domain-containing protein n=1 Tax=Streptomyces hoynatensis TaxID=1141874 RepID=A0A3A9YV90_9ACTN|nr:hypothetical protein [Streptomyces hoynatensis]RKN39167.1 hypothetical protein D7294_21545 [Streptomyces hoynatensis]